jgi:hypothetical protein
MSALAFSYQRFPREQQRHGSSVERQVHSAQQYAAAHNLLLDISTYWDLGGSAFQARNPVEAALSAFVQAVDAGKIPSGVSLLVEPRTNAVMARSHEESGIAECYEDGATAWAASSGGGGG